MPLQSLDLFAMDQAAGEFQQLPWFSKLWAAILRRAAVDLVLYRGHESQKLGKLGDDAHEWIFCDKEDALDDPCSFVFVCAALNIDVGIVRNRILSITEADARRLRGLDFDDEET